MRTRDTCNIHYALHTTTTSFTNSLAYFTYIYREYRAVLKKQELTADATLINGIFPITVQHTGCCILFCKVS